MLRWFLPNVPLVVGRDRVAAARLAFEASPESVLVMDDGFQHLPLRHDLGLVLDPARPKNGHCLPAGPYREPRFERKRADLVIGAGSRFEVARRPLSFVSGVTGEKVALEAADVLCALGRPQGFVADLERVGVRLGERRLLPDHDPLTAGTLLEGLSSPWVVVTAKDWVKLRSRGDLDLSRIVVALQQVTVEPAAEFEAFVWQRIPS
jgi:tetraacyldisaccharide 4'-kinase